MKVADLMWNLLQPKGVSKIELRGFLRIHPVYVRHPITQSPDDRCPTTTVKLPPLDTKGSDGVVLVMHPVVDDRGVKRLSPYSKLFVGWLKLSSAFLRKTGDDGNVRCVFRLDQDMWTLDDLAEAVKATDPVVSTPIRFTARKFNLDLSTAMHWMLDYAVTVAVTGYPPRKTPSRGKCKSVLQRNSNLPLLTCILNESVGSSNAFRQHVVEDAVTGYRRVVISGRFEDFPSKWLARRELLLDKGVATISLSEFLEPDGETVGPRILDVISRVIVRVAKSAVRTVEDVMARGTDRDPTREFIMSRILAAKNVDRGMVKLPSGLSSVRDILGQAPLCVRGPLLAQLEMRNSERWKQATVVAELASILNVRWQDLLVVVTESMRESDLNKDRIREFEQNVKWAAERTSNPFKCIDMPGVYGGSGCPYQDKAFPKGDNVKMCCRQLNVKVDFKVRGDAIVLMIVCDCLNSHCAPFSVLLRRSCGP